MTIMRAQAERGFTLIEAMVSLAIFSVLALVISTFIIDSQKVNFTVEAQTDASLMGQQGLDDLRWRLEQSRRLLDGGSGMLPLVDLSAAPPAAGEIRLPKIEPNGALTPKAVDKKTAFEQGSVGNAVFFVEALQPYREPRTGRLVDLYRFVLYYVAKHEGDGQKFAHMPFCLDVVRWESVVYADFQQLDSLDDELETSMVNGLAAKGIGFAWDAGSPAEAAFTRLAGGRMQRPPEPRHRIAQASATSAFPGIGRGQRIAGVIGYSVAPNDGEVPIRNKVPKYAQPADGFPNGFEVLIAGPGHGRKVMVRLVIAAETHGRFYSREHQMIAAVWD